MNGLLRQILSSPFAIRRIENKMDQLLLLNARAYVNSFDYDKPLESFEKVEFRVFSQWGDDGIIQYLINKLKINEKKFIEFGVENYRESNTRFLLLNNNWKGLIFDGSASHIAQIKADEIYWRQDLTAECAFITSENINELITKNGFNTPIGILHIDIDGNDYWIWHAINTCDADIVIMEYNAYWGDERPVTIPYNPVFSADAAHYSRIYFGSSLPALVLLAEKKGYFHIGCNSAGNNAYFIKNKYKGQMKVINAKDGFVMPTFRQTRDKEGKLDYLSPSESTNLLRGLTVTNVVTGQNEAF